MSRPPYDWSGFLMHFTLGAFIGALIGLGLNLFYLTPGHIPILLLAFLTNDARVADVVFWALVIGCVGGIYRDRFWFWWLTRRYWPRR
jgi:membrane protein DedA with SNARE-associated domain